ncbi:hypothetical protein GGTG_13152 [Gaeumannomyces tritici R3-111a-1]|uniref:Uncharacterized protein n=1 Tax=Gaeumannomyces tritici (strain R3-111a-1) TaxID=644352 RepID=J3PI21_GAET3|nr:hypothetical protein GGTG_13152 [Gaeumannomyces tritici R3-111a-1]EJT69533.1 hypothetical protein GGTG_13152 [Gaeumannomyces tritici R3-111a-1]
MMTSTSVAILPAPDPCNVRPASVADTLVAAPHRAESPRKTTLEDSIVGFAPVYSAGAPQTAAAAAQVGACGPDPGVALRRP